MPAPRALAHARLQCALADRCVPGVAVAAAEGERAGVYLGKAAARDNATERDAVATADVHRPAAAPQRNVPGIREPSAGLKGSAVEGQRAGAQVPAAATDGQRAGADCRAVGVVIRGIGKGERAAAVLRHRAAADDRGRAVVGVESSKVRLPLSVMVVPLLSMMEPVEPPLPISSVPAWAARRTFCGVSRAASARFKHRRNASLTKFSKSNPTLGVLPQG